ncbi:MAG: type II secretion system F family protein [Candidatus Thermoplasmatota archaeon]|nr:hypothetical protein [Euryarchaeota archaeon]MBU4031882.1 type II secretion system F family protein [Candidatus Thermoplasmatota archaeon]MBU4071057.1 type II secretion system F family protein [Candidatus Thermoplasmatota archaeon]MBU4143818.1 type II secretion system F family protein [Candidatus Thermoplasmatota archaeon]MBU4591603.1 type II secretion system F family protein [Candidatus Thermoplasmatota archaeon]
MSEPGKPGETYRKLCKTLGKAKPNPEKLKKLDADIRELRQGIRQAESLEAAQRLASADKTGMKQASSDLESKRRQLEKLVRIREQKDFKRAMRITGMGLHTEEVVRFSAIIGFMGFIIALAVVIPAAMWFGLEPFMVLAVSAAASISVPMLIFMMLVNYPERLARSLEMEAFGSAPEVINYMVMSMELSPSIDRAVLFAAENAEGPMADELKSLIWKVQAREFATTEDALMSYAGELESSNEELRSAIYNILSASKESEHEKMRASLRRASESVMTGTKQRVEGFAASLSTPATVLFSLGILLPMIIGSMLPMLSLGGLNMGPQPAATQEESWVPIFVLSVLVMDLMFPIIALVYSNSILAKRPGMHTVAPPERHGILNKLPFSGVILAGFAGLGYISGTYMNFWEMEWSIAALVAILGASAAAWYILAWGTRINSMKKIEKLEDRMPDMLFQLGSRLGEGLALERAIEDVSRTMADTEIGEFLGDVLARMRRSGAGLSGVLFSRDIGILNTHPSRKLRAAMRLVVEAAGKDPDMAGSILITMSNHMRELANSDKDMRLKLRSTIDSMKNTAILFAPVIMGVTVGLYSLLSRTFGEMNGAETMPAPLFIMIIGIYLLMTVATIMYFCAGIEHGRGRWKRDAGIALPVAALIFCVCSLGALMAFG